MIPALPALRKLPDMIPSIHDKLAFLLVRDQRNIARRAPAERNNSAAPTFAKQFRQEDSRWYIHFGRDTGVDRRMKRQKHLDQPIAIACRILLLAVLFAAASFPRVSTGKAQARNVGSRVAVAPMRKLYPVDEAAKDPGFKAFRDALLDAARRHDRERILNSLDPKIDNESDESGQGVRYFKQKWELGGNKESKLWETLETILSMGGAFSTEEGVRYFCAPYVSSSWPDDAGLDSPPYYAVVGDRVLVRQGPASRSPVVTSLSYDIVEDIDRRPEPEQLSSGYTKIMIPGTNYTGYVSSLYLRSSMDFRACFKRVRGKWVMSSLVAGD
jgi:hypothetical protein